MYEIARGLEGVVLTGTRLSHVDGERGELIIGGYPVDELAPNATFEEVLYLLWHGRLPLRAEAEEIARSMAAQRDVPPVTMALLRAAAERRLPTMDALRVAVGTLALAVP